MCKAVMLFVLVMMLNGVLYAEGFYVRYLEIKTSMELVEERDAWKERSVTNCVPLVEELFDLVKVGRSQVLVDQTAFIEKINTDYLIHVDGKEDVYYADSEDDVIILKKWEEACGVFFFARARYYPLSGEERLVVELWSESKMLKGREEFSYLPQLKAGRPILKEERHLLASVMHDNGTFLLGHGAVDGVGIVRICQVSREKKISWKLGSKSP